MLLWRLNASNGQARIICKSKWRYEWIRLSDIISISLTYLCKFKHESGSIRESFIVIDWNLKSNKELLLIINMYINWNINKQYDQVLYKTFNSSCTVKTVVIFWRGKRGFLQAFKHKIKNKLNFFRLFRYWHIDTWGSFLTLMILLFLRKNPYIALFYLILIFQSLKESYILKKENKRH